MSSRVGSRVWMLGPLDMRLAVLASLLTAACTESRTAESTDRDRAAPTAVHAAEGATMQDSVFKLVGERPGIPPLVRLTFHVTVTNPTTRLQWVIIPTKLPASAGGGVDKLEQLSAGGVQLGRFL